MTMVKRNQAVALAFMLIVGLAACSKNGDADAKSDIPFGLLPTELAAVMVVTDIGSFEKKLSSVLSAAGPEVAESIDSNQLVQMFLGGEYAVDKSKGLAIAMLPVKSKDARPQFVCVVPFVDADEAFQGIEALGLPGKVLRDGNYISCAPFGGEFEVGATSALLKALRKADVSIRGDCATLIAPFSDSIEGVLENARARLLEQQGELGSIFTDEYLDWLSKLHQSAKTIDLTVDVDSESVDWRTHVVIKEGSPLSTTKTWRANDKMRHLAHHIDGSHAMKMVGNFDTGMMNAMLGANAKAMKLMMAGENEATQAEVEEAIGDSEAIVAMLTPEFAASINFNGNGVELLALRPSSAAKEVMAKSRDSMKSVAAIAMGIEFSPATIKDEDGFSTMASTIKFDAEQFASVIGRSAGNRAPPADLASLEKVLEKLNGEKGHIEFFTGAREDLLVTAFGIDSSAFAERMKSLASEGTPDLLNSAFDRAIEDPGLLVDVDMRALTVGAMQMAESFGSNDVPPIPTGDQAVPLTMSFGFQERTFSMGMHLNLVRAIKFFKSIGN